MNKRIAALLAALALLCFGTHPSPAAEPLSAQAQKLFPHGLTIVVGFGNGGTVDTGARVVQPYLQKVLGVPIVVQNMPGAGGITAAHYVYTQDANAPIVLMSFLPALTLAQIIGKGAFDVRKMTPIYGVFGHNTAVIIARKGSPYKDFASLKAAKTPITAGVAGVKASSTWEALAELAEINGIRMIPVPFEGGAAGSDSALGGSIDVSATTLVEATRLVGSGRAQAVLQFAPGPLPELPGVESIAKVGKASEVLDTPQGLTGPPGMPQDEVRVLSAALEQVVKDPAFADKAKNVGLFVKAEDARGWSKTLNQSYDFISQVAPQLEKFTPG